MSVLSDRDIRAALEAGRVRIDPYDPADLQPSSVDLHLDRSFRVFRNNRYAYIDPRAAAAGPDRAADDRGRRAVHPPSGRVRAGPDARVGGAAGRPRRPARGQVESLGRLGLLIHSTAGYVDPGWKGNLTLELSNVANLPIALYFGMRIGQISFFRMTQPGRAAVRVARSSARSTRASPSRPRPRSTATSTRAPDRRSEGGGADGDQRRRRLARPTSAAGRRRARPGRARSGPTPARSFGPVPWVLWGALVAEASWTTNRRLLQALNCLLIETPAGRVLVETGIGERVDEKTRRCAATRARRIVPGAASGRVRPGIGRRRGDEPPPLRPRRRPAPGRRVAGVPAGEDRRPARRVGDRARRQPAPRRLLRPAGAAAGRATGAPRAGPTASARSCPACPSSRPAATPRATRRSSCAGRDRARGRWRSSATCACARGPPTRAGSPRSTTSRSTASRSRASCSRGPPRRTGSWSCRTSRGRRSGALVRDRDRFRFEAL